LYSFSSSLVGLLEGTREPVRYVYFDIINRDLRHRALELAYEEAIEQRGFADWTMGFAELPVPNSTSAPAAADKIEGHLSEPDFSSPKFIGRRLLEAIYRQL
jgi:hypothetical protein